MNASSKPFPFPTADSHDPLPENKQSVELPVSEDALDQGVAESFPASDPVSVTVTKVIGKPEDEADRRGFESESESKKGSGAGH